MVTSTQLLFICITLLCGNVLYRATNKSKPILWAWWGLVALQGLLGLVGVYQVNTVPPRFPLLILPALGLTIWAFSNAAFKQHILQFNLKALTLLHTLRVLVEVVLYFLFTEKLIPVEMTFEGLNFDIVTGLTAPLVCWFAFNNNKVNKSLLIAFNCMGLLLLSIIVVVAILSAETPLQQFGYTQPNVAVTYFPYIWLPAVVVPTMLFAHLAALYKLVRV